MTASPLEAVVPLSSRLLCVVISQLEPSVNLTPNTYAYIPSFTQKCLDLGAATAIVYDFCLTFERERRVVWNQAGSRVNFTKVLWVAVGVHSSSEFPVPPFTLTHQHRYGNLINYFLIAPSLNYANVSCSQNRRFDTLTCNAAVSISDYIYLLSHCDRSP